MSRIAAQDHPPVVPEDRKGFSRVYRKSILVAYDWTCAICHEPILSVDDCEVDHRVPLALGGTNKIENLEPAHVLCHLTKTKRDVGRIAKATRLRKKNAAPDETTPRKAKRRRIPSRPFQKRAKP
jgi:5-methylcytosine-specific restriction endonuclease McrA